MGLEFIIIIVAKSLHNVRFILHYVIFVLHLNVSKKYIYMETKFLLPNKFKRLGWILLSFSIILWIYAELIIKDDIELLKTTVFVIVGNDFLKDTEYFSFINTNITYTLIGMLFIIGGLLVIFSREKIEDEFISKLRLLSFQWSFMMNYLVLLFLFLFVYGMGFLYVLMYYMFTTMILFIVHFEYSFFKYKNLDYEK